MQKCLGFCCSGDCQEQISTVTGRSFTSIVHFDDKVLIFLISETTTNAVATRLLSLNKGKTKGQEVMYLVRTQNFPTKLTFLTP